MPITTIICRLLSFLLLLSAAAAITPLRHHRHLLHHPLFFQTTLPPTYPPSLSPSASSRPPPQLHQEPKYPFSTTPPSAQQNPFFPTIPSPPPPPPSPPSSLPTFPANISSLLLPHPSSSASSHRHILLISLSASLLAAALLLSLAILILFLRRRNYRRASSPIDKTDSLRLFPPNTAPSDASLKPVVSTSTLPPQQPPHYVSTNRSSEFLYLGTLVNAQPGISKENPARPPSNAGKKIGLAASPGSPELKPLPPLPRLQNYPSGEQFLKSGEVSVAREQVKANGAEEDNEEFFSPRGSSGRRESPPARIGSSSRREFLGENFGSRSFNSRTASYPYSHSCSPSNSIPDSSPPSQKSNSPDSVIAANFAARPRASFSASSSSSTISSLLERGRSSFSGPNKQSPPRTVPMKIPPPPPPFPPARFWEIPAAAKMNREPISGPPPLVAPSGPVVVQSVGVNEQEKESEGLEKSEDAEKPKLKPLHWDKVRASSDRAMVWDQIKASSFQLNEEMIETLFMVNNPNMAQRDGNRRPVSVSLNQENRVLDPKKSQNVAILLRALNVTADEVCEALMEGNSDTLGAELLESLLKMAPTKEEEHNLKDFKDESPFKLGPAEKFLKSMLDIPFAFKRVDAMLYMVNFDSEVEYLKRSFETLEAACGELRNSRMFLKLLEAVLKTGNRMNVGTNRGDAHAFKLDTLLKLVDVKGTDGKTTLLHFVVQEIIRAEGLSVSSASQNQKVDKAHQPTFQDDVEFRKLGLQVVSGLSGELTNVKKAATMDSDVLSSDVAKLAAGISKVTEVIKLNEEIALKDRSCKFADSMIGFLKKAEEEIVLIKGQENASLSKVKEITEYFHGNSSKEEAHPFRIFTVVRDFLSVLDHVCKEVGKINERTIYSSVRPLPVNPMAPPVFPGLTGRQHYGSSDDESLNRHSL